MFFFKQGRLDGDIIRSLFCVQVCVHVQHIWSSIWYLSTCKMPPKFFCIPNNYWKVVPASSCGCTKRPGNFNTAENLQRMISFIQDKRSCCVTYIKTNHVDGNKSKRWLNCKGKESGKSLKTSIRGTTCSYVQIKFCLWFSSHGLIWS